MKKLLLLSFVLFSFSSFGQTISSKEVIRHNGKTVRADVNTGFYGLSSQNAKYSHITDIKSFIFSNKTELVTFLDSLDKFTNISNYSTEYEGAGLTSTINGKEYKFNIRKTNSFIMNPEKERLRAERDSVQKTITSLRKQIQYREEMQIKIDALPLTVNTPDYLELNIFVEGGWVKFTNETITEIKKALK
jgi:hypothetical protein